MAENSSIEWTDHTFNPWIGCTKVSAACDFCYAEALDNRFFGGTHWGPGAPRKRTTPANWNKMKQWNAQARKSGKRPRVFIASLADIADKEVPQEWKDDLRDLINACESLDILLLTKRPQMVRKYYPDDMLEKCWVGCTVEDQTEADRRIPHLLKIPARVRFLSCEPLLGAVDLSLDGLWFEDCAACADGAPFTCPETGAWECSACDSTGKHDYDVGIDWVIAGGESGPNFRPGNVDWFRSLRDQCAAAGVPFLFKQYEGTSQPVIKALGRALDGVVHDGYPQPRTGA